MSPSTESNHSTLQLPFMEPKPLPLAGEHLDNTALAAHLSAIADSLEAAREGVHRVRAFRAAAVSIGDHPQPVAKMSREELEELPGVGPRIAGVLCDHVESRSHGMLERLHRAVGPLDHLTLLDGVGEVLAERIHTTLAVNGLRDLARAIDRIGEVEGVGASTAERIRRSLDGILARRSEPMRARRRPSVRLLLEVDEHYRRAVAEGALPTIAPRQNNPDGERWLPLLRTELEGWTFRAMFSNTELAHQQGRTDDWVVVFGERDGEEMQATVVTETRGRMVGERVVRGREGESRRHHLDLRVGPASHAA